MIFTERQITVYKGKSSINESVILYRGDYEVSVKFTIVETKFRFKNGINLAVSEKASHGQLAVLTPYGGNVFSEIVKCEDGSVTFTLTKEMIDQLEEVGLYSFQIRLFDYYKESRVSIPPVEFGIEVREPVASEDHDNEVNNAIVGYSIAKVVDGLNEIVGPTFDDDENYNKTDWETGDRISEEKLNKIEDALDKINRNKVALNKQMTSNFNVLQNQIDNMVIESGNTDVEVEQARGDYNLLNQRLNAMDETDVELASQLAHKPNKEDLFINVKDFGAKGDGINDDTESLKNAILSIGRDYSKGGTVYIPKGKYKITDTIFISSNIKVVGDGNTSYFSKSIDDVGTYLLFECSDLEKPCISFIFEKAGANKNYNYTISGSDLDNGVVNQSTSSALKNLTLISTNNHNVGIVFSGAPLSTIEDVSIKGFLGGIIVSGNWGSNINRCFINTSIFGVLANADVNNIQISNCYIDGTENYDIDSTNKLYSFLNTSDFYLKNKKTGILARYAYNLKVVNTCIEHWEVGIQIGGSGASTNFDTVWLENDAQPITVQSYQHSFKNVYIYGSTSESVILAIDTTLSLENFHGNYTKLFKDAYQRNCEVIINNCLDNNIRIPFLNSADELDKVYIDEQNGNNYYFGNRTMPVQSLWKAFELVADGGEIILLSDVNVSDASRINNKRVTIKTDGNTRTLSPQKANSLIRAIEVFNSSITFSEVNIDCFISASSTGDTSYSGFIKPIGMFKNEVSFYNCTINTKSNYGILQHDYDSNSYLRLTLQGGKITGNGAMSRNAYNPSGKLHIEEFKQGCSIDSTVTAYGSSSVIIHQY